MRMGLFYLEVKMSDGLKFAIPFFIFFVLGFCVTSVSPTAGLCFAVVLVVGGFGFIAYLLRGGK